MAKIKIGVFGAGRGRNMISFCRAYPKAELVAICDFDKYFLDVQKEKCGTDGITYYTNFDEFIKHDMDAVVLANYANEHAPFAIKCLKAGKNVFSEVLPVQCLKEAVELVEAVEQTGKVYAYGENYCFMPANREMKRLYKEGALGEFEYGEGEYMHNCEPIWHTITRGEPDHWRNNLYCTFYCTHSTGPIIHSTGLRPVKVVGFELPYNARSARMGTRCGSVGIEMITFENGAILKSIHGLANSKNSIWTCMYGSKGRLESAREDTLNGDVSMLYANLDKNEGDNSKIVQAYKPIDKDTEASTNYGHGGSDYVCLKNFIDKLNGDQNADTIDVYEALDMFLPGLIGYFSILDNNKSMEIPNFRDPEVRKQFAKDTRCVDPKVAKDMLIPAYSKGEITVDKSTYEFYKNKWENSIKK